LFLQDPTGAELLALIEKADRHDQTLWIGWSRYELRREEWNIDLGEHSRRVYDALKRAGHSVGGGEALDGAGWGCWRARVASILEEFFPSGSTASSQGRN
jgi:hypothetical protein